MWDTLDPSSFTFQNCQAAGVPVGFTPFPSVHTNVGGNPDLDAEDSTLFGLGLVVTPRWIENLSLTLDYYDIEIDNAITNPQPQTILDNCYNTPTLPNPDCAWVTRAGNGLITNLEAPVKNIGKIEASGLEIEILYSFPVPYIGDFDLQAYGHYLLDYEEFVPQKVKRNGTIAIGNGGGTFTNFKASLRGTLRGESWEFSSIVNYIGRADVQGVPTNSAPTDDVADVMYLDMTFRYDFDQWAFFFGAHNVTDKDPPFLPNGAQNASPKSYRFMGRYYFAKARYVF